MESLLLFICAGLLLLVAAALLLAGEANRIAKVADGDVDKFRFDIDQIERESRSANAARADELDNLLRRVEALEGHRAIDDFIFRHPDSDKEPA